MAKRKTLIVGNWKMAPETEAEAALIFSGIKRAAIKLGSIQAVICPPDLFVSRLVKLAGGSSIRVGVQDVFYESVGFHTGKRSASQAYRAGARFSIVGHSEMRAQGDTDVLVEQKASESVRVGLHTIVCVGEATRDSEGQYWSHIRQQVLSAVGRIPRESFQKYLTIAYEPLWTVGRADFVAMKPHDVHEVTIFIRKVLSDAYGRDSADAVRVLYGGSVTSESAGQIVSDGGVDGLLVGRYSLDANLFSGILSAVA